MPLAGETIRTPEMVATILERIGLGEVGADVCNGKDGMPSWPTFKRWMRNDEELRTAYACAREDGVEQNESELLREARRKPVDSVDAAGQRTLVDTLKWRLSKRLPKDFGDRQQVEHSGSLSLGDAIARTAARRAAEQSEPES